MTPLSPTSLDLTQDNIEQIKALFPNVFTEGKIDFDALKAELGEHLEVEGERYQFTWNAKAKAIANLSEPESPVLRVVFRDSSFADDNVKTNAVQRLKQVGIEDVVSV
jgi:adenine-specific DNA-methyltransferase